MNVIASTVCQRPSNIHVFIPNTFTSLLIRYPVVWGKIAYLAITLSIGGSRRLRLRESKAISPQIFAVNSR